MGNTIKKWAVSFNNLSAGSGCITITTVPTRRGLAESQEHLRHLILNIFSAEKPFSAASLMWFLAASMSKPIGMPLNRC